jgi:serine/threonine protein kinase
MKKPKNDPNSELDGDFAPVGDMSLGRILFDRFELIAAPERDDSLIGQGGMGVIHLAHDQLLDRTVAVKILPPDVIFDDNARLDLLAETRQALALTHQNIVRVYDFHESTRERLWGISMQYVRGTNLSDLRSKDSFNGSSRIPFSVERIFPWVRQICDALIHAHEFAELVHRDLNPRNIMLEIRKAPGEAHSHEHILITDFGIAASIRHSLQKSVSYGDRSKAGAGTLPYMPWEQINGEAPSAANDIYALGATIYDLLTGRPPFFGGPLESIMTQIESAAPPSVGERRHELATDLPDEIPDDWEALIQDCLRKEPGQRPKSIREIADRLGFDTPKRSVSAAPIGIQGVKASPTGVAKPAVLAGPVSTTATSNHLTQTPRTDSRMLSVVMFTDLVGSVALQERLGTLAYADFVEQHDLIVHSSIAEADGGEIISDTGDGFLIRFNDPSDAVESALRLQFLAKHTLVEGEPIRIRVGIHLGVITELGERLGGKVRRVGMALNLAARVMDLGSGGQILVTRAIFDDARQYIRKHPSVEGFTDLPPVVWMVHGDYLFKGSNEPLAIFEIGAETIAPLSPPSDGLKGKRVNDDTSGLVIASLPQLPVGDEPQEATPGEGRDADEVEAQREEFEEAQRALQAEIERLNQSQARRDQEIKHEAEMLAAERERLEDLSVELAARREEEANVLADQQKRAQEDHLQIQVRSEELAAALAAKKAAFEAKLEQRAGEMLASSEQRLQELENREHKLVELEQRLAEEHATQEDVAALKQQLERLRRERDDFRQQEKDRRLRMEEEWSLFNAAQEDERADAARRAARESKLKEEIHSVALAQLEQSLAEQEAEIHRQREELERAEQQIEESQAAVRSPDLVAKKENLAEQLKLESNRFATKVGELNGELEEIRRVQKRRLTAIAVGSMVLALVVGVASAKIIWGFWPWKLFEGSAEVQPNLVLKKLGELEGQGDWLGLLATAIPAADKLQAEPEDNAKAAAFARQAMLQLAVSAGPAGQYDPTQLIGLLDQVAETGWELPPSHGFLVARSHIAQAQGSPRLVGLPAAISKYIACQSNPVSEELSVELDGGIAELLTRLEAIIANADPLPDEKEIGQALAELPEIQRQRFPLVGLIQGQMEIRTRLARRPSDLAGAAAQLERLCAENPEWRVRLSNQFEALIARLADADSSCPHAESLISLAKLWADPRPLTMALDRLESDDQSYAPILKFLWSEFYINRRAGVASLPPDAQAWIGMLAVNGGNADLVSRGSALLQQASKNGSAKAKLFLVDYNLIATAPPSGPPSAKQLEAWRILAEEALAGGQNGALVVLGTIHWLDAVSGSDIDLAAIQTARGYFRKAVKHCVQKRDQRKASKLLAVTYAGVKAEDLTGRRERAAAHFYAGISLWEESQIVEAKKNWNLAMEVDHEVTQKLIKRHIESAETSGQSEFAKELRNWQASRRQLDSK